MARRCSGCGTTFDSAAAVPYPYPRPLGSPSWDQPPRTNVAMRIAQGLAVLICLISGLTVAQGENAGEMMGSAMGGAAAPLALAALFLAWSHRTRPYIPFLAVAILFLGVIGNADAALEERDRERIASQEDERLAREERDRELSQRRILVSAWMDSSGSGMRALPGGGTAAPPWDDRAALAWAVNRVIRELPAYRREVAARHGIDPDQPPSAWGTARYAANASAHPEVERFWRGYRAFHADYVEGMSGWLRARAREHVRAADVSPDMLEASMREVEEEADGLEMEASEWADSAAAVGLEIHRFLVSADARVRYDGRRGKALFESDADLRRVNRLDRRFKAAVTALQRANQRHRENAMQELDSLAIYLQ